MKPFINVEYIFQKVYDFFIWLWTFAFGGSQGFAGPSSTVIIVVAFISVVLAIGVAYNLYKIFRMNKQHLAELTKIVTDVSHEERKTEWDGIKKHIDSDNESDWRMAVLEADSLMEDIIKKIGYKGETFGDRLSKVKSSQLKSIDEVWFAHKMRNRIAHEGKRFKLTKGSAQKIIDSYEKAFKELEYI
ncbi:hypothetical protein ACFLZC_02060 [Patescibacteria group bacterium]